MTPSNNELSSGALPVAPGLRHGLPLLFCWTCIQVHPPMGSRHNTCYPQATDATHTCHRYHVVRTIPPILLRQPGTIGATELALCGSVANPYGTLSFSLESYL